MFKFNLKIILYVIGILLAFNGGLMLLAALISLLMDDGVYSEMTLCAFIVMGMGASMVLVFRNHHTNIQKKRRLSYCYNWLAINGSNRNVAILDYGSIDSVCDAFFETMSGYTATGSTILTDIESLPAGILFWRSMMHWIGGMGIIVLAIAILPLLGIGGMQLFSAEAPRS